MSLTMESAHLWLGRLGLGEGRIRHLSAALKLVAFEHLASASYLSSVPYDAPKYRYHLFLYG